MREGVDDKMLINEEPNGKATKWDRSAALYLVKHLRKRGYANRVRINTWADYIRILRTSHLGHLSDAVARNRIRMTMRWYVRHINGPYIPQVYSAKAFRTKFDSLHAHATRSGVFDVQLEIAPEVAKMAARLESLGWPGITTPQLAAVLQGDVTAYAAWRLNALHVATITRGNLQRFAAWFVTQLPDPYHVIEQWYGLVNRQIKGWDNWDGNLRTLRWHPQHRRHHQHCRGLATEYGSVSFWDQFSKELCSYEGKGIQSGDRAEGID